MLNLHDQWKPYRFATKCIHNHQLCVFLLLDDMAEFATLTKDLTTGDHFNGVEVLLHVNDPSLIDRVLFEVTRYPFINWIVTTRASLIDRDVHAWDSLLKITSKACVLMLREAVPLGHELFMRLGTLLTEYRSSHFVCYYNNDFEKKDLDHVGDGPYKRVLALAARSSVIQLLGGFNLDLPGWELENLSARLELHGISKVYVCLNNPPCKKRVLELVEPRMLRHTFFPSSKEVCLRELALPKSKIRHVYNYRRNAFSEERCKKYLSHFTKFEIKDKFVFSNKYRQVILCQAYNEEEYITSFLNNMSLYFDGVILLDDNSDDATYSLARHEKLLLKVQKKRVGFNDLENRNILLDLASFIDSEWFCVMDVDEKFDERFADFQKITDRTDIDTVAFQYIHLWDTDSYNVGPDNKLGGISVRLRMFRNLGSCQIHTTKKKLHFDPIPFRNNPHVSSILVHHLGNSSYLRRLNKFDFYAKEDLHGDSQNYKYLLTNPPLRKVSDITAADFVTTPRDSILDLQMFD